MSLSTAVVVLVAVRDFEVPTHCPCFVWATIKNPRHIVELLEKGRQQLWAKCDIWLSTVPVRLNNNPRYKYKPRTWILSNQFSPFGDSNWFCDSLLLYWCAAFSMPGIWSIFLWYGLASLSPQFSRLDRFLGQHLSMARLLRRKWAGKMWKILAGIKQTLDTNEK